MAQVGIIMGSDSDFSVMQQASLVLDDFGLAYEVKVSSAHRSLDHTVEWARNFVSSGGQVIIAGAGLAAHLPGVIAGAVNIPVIGVPINAGALSGVDALYSIVQMPPGVPVATVAINGAKNAGILAAQILAVGDVVLQEKIAKFRTDQADQVRKKDEALSKQIEEADNRA